MKMLKILLLGSLLFCFTHFLASAQPTISDSGRSDIEKAVSKQTAIVPINNAEEARIMALLYTGFDKISNYDFRKNMASSKVIIENDNTPFLNKRIMGNEIWLVEFSDIPPSGLRYRSDLKVKATIQVLLEPKTGKLLKISSQFSDEEYECRIRDSVSYAETWLQRRSVEYIDLPDMIPCPFIEVIQKRGYNITKAIGFEALYVLRKSIKDKAPVPRWIISAYGLPQRVDSPPVIKDSGRSKPIVKTIRTYYLIIVDAITGQTLRAAGYENP